MDLEYYKNMKDYLTTDELNRLFKSYLDSFDKRSLSTNLEILYGLSDRQWHTYKLLQESIREDVDLRVLTVLKTSYLKVSLIDVENILFAIGSLGLERSFLELENFKVNNTNMILNKEIVGFIKEIGTMSEIKNPYRNL